MMMIMGVAVFTFNLKSSSLSMSQNILLPKVLLDVLITLPAFLDHLPHKYWDLRYIFVLNNFHNLASGGVWSRFGLVKLPAKEIATKVAFIVLCVFKCILKMCARGLYNFPFILTYKVGCK